jgi:hypothetical protein
MERLGRLIVMVLIATLAAWLAAWLAAGPASASRTAKPKEAKAIKKGFMKPRDDVKTIVDTIRVSTVDKKYAGVDYEVKLEELEPIGEEEIGSPGASLREKKTYPAPSPVILKKKGSKWKPVPKPPSKVKKDLKGKPKGRIDITGETAAVLSVPANCGNALTDDYRASVYDPVGDVYLSFQFPRYRGPGIYPALAVNSLASLAVGNMGGVPQWETGQGSDAFSPSGAIYVDPDGWGIIEATMARTGGVYPQSVLVSGFWDCG